jgi:hypothetical protein
MEIMVNALRWLCLGGFVIGTIGCASTTWNGYPGGSVKFSEISYNYVAQPVFKDPAGKTYQIQNEAGLSGINTISTLEKKGVHKAANGADVVFKITAGEITHEPGGFGLGKSYKPAVFSTMPLKITVNDKEGNAILENEFKHEEILTVNGREYPTQEEAKNAMKVITAIAKSSADAKVRGEAPSTVNKNLSQMSKDLFESRKVSVTLPALRSSGNVTMEEAYKLLSKAKSDEQVKAALAAYVALGVEHKKTDGTDDSLGIYGVYCGLASAKILSGDLSGAWDDTKKAWKILPMGKEYKMIARVLHQQEQQTGKTVTDQADYTAIMNEKSYEVPGNDMMKDFMKH